MKKLLIITCAFAVLSGSAFASEYGEKPNQTITNNQTLERRIPPTKEQMEQHRKDREEIFEKKLGLTEVQKLKARELRKSGFEKIKPIVDELRLKKQEAKKISNSDISIELKEEQLTKLDKEIADLQKEASKIRKQNMKDFESILTKQQKKTLEQMKKEGREKFHKEHDGKRFMPPPCHPENIK